MTPVAPSWQPAARAPSAYDIVRHCGCRSCCRNTTWAKDRHRCFSTPVLHPVATIFMFKIRAVALDVARRTTFLALVAALRISLCRSTPKNGRRRRYHAQVVYVDVDCGLFSLFEVERTIPRTYLLYELEFFRTGFVQHIGVGVGEDLLSHALQPQPQVVHCRFEVNSVANWFHGLFVVLRVPFLAPFSLVFVFSFLSFSV